jgi:DNA-binding transcriptional ArsR family regulator
MGKPRISRTESGMSHRLKQIRRKAIFFKQVSDPTRLQVVLMLSEGEMHVGALCDELSQSQPAVSHHLALLRHGGIISPRRRGKNNFYSLTDTGETLASVVKIITEDRSAQSHVPNAETRRAMRGADAGEFVGRYESVEAMAEDLLR